MNKVCRIRSRRGFSLVELVIVILILGILAAVAAPRMFDTATSARENGTRRSLSVVRNAVELYRAQNGALPPAADQAAFKAALTSYLQGPFPRAEVGNAGDSVRIATGNSALAASGTESWAYNSTTGQFVVNHSSFIAW
ncbi:MAG: prepilin-type N-terminal cleavage/methylation domain-containing protein [Planctomycetaceae bacterium]|nr:prepilin-type N-terminal cleavage/methylation domain-containing protein [Planctomycetaceae bacterium]